MLAVVPALTDLFAFSKRALAREGVAGRMTMRVSMRVSIRVSMRVGMRVGWREGDPRNRGHIGCSSAC